MSGFYSMLITLFVLIFAVNFLWYIFSGFSGDDVSVNKEDERTVVNTLVIEADHIVPYILKNTACRDIVLNKSLMNIIIKYKASYNFNLRK